MIKKRIIIRGPRVHDVGYRLFLLDEAEYRLIPYFSARNIKNKAEVVEVLVGGDKDRVEDFVEFVKNTFPEDAEVESVSVEDYAGDIRTIESFSRSFSISQLSKIARIGVKMLEKQDAMLEKQDAMLEKQDETISILKDVKRDTSMMIEKQDETISILKDVKCDTSIMLEKQDETIKSIKSLSGSVDQGREEVVAEIKALRDDLKSHFDERLSRLEEEVSQIKAKISM